MTGGGAPCIQNGKPEHGAIGHVQRPLRAGTFPNAIGAQFVAKNIHQESNHGIGIRHHLGRVGGPAQASLGMHISQLRHLATAVDTHAMDIVGPIKNSFMNGIAAAVGPGHLVFFDVIEGAEAQAAHMGIEGLLIGIGKAHGKGSQFQGVPAGVDVGGIPVQHQ